MTIVLSGISEQRVPRVGREIITAKEPVTCPFGGGCLVPHLRQNDDALLTLLRHVFSRVFICLETETAEVNFRKSARNFTRS